MGIYSAGGMSKLFVFVNAREQNDRNDKDDDNCLQVNKVNNDDL